MTYEHADDKRLENFLNSDEVLDFVYNRGLDPEEVEWFAQTHVSDSLCERSSEEGVGVASLFCLLGIDVESPNNDEPWADSEHEAVLKRLGYDERTEPDDWKKVYHELLKHGRFNKTILRYVKQLDHRTSDFAEQRVILAAAEIAHEDAHNSQFTEHMVRICNEHDTTYSYVSKFFDELRRDD
jgi:hypothetical protein